MNVPPWPVLISVLSGLGTVYLCIYIWEHRRKPGADWFLLVLACQAVWCFSYGTSLLVFEPSSRLALEMLTWITMSWIGVAFLGFALVYTGRGNFVRTWGFAVPVVVSTATTVLVVTNPLHQLVWSDFELDSVFGAATVSYTFGGWAYFAVGVGALAVAAGTLLLFDTVLSYGPLYRTEALAVGFSTVPPGVALVVWLLELGPVPQLNAATLLFVPHVVLDGYAFVRGGMFEYNPVTRRTAERSAIEDLESPVLTVDTEDRLVTFNASARHVFDLDETVDLGKSVETVTDHRVELDDENQVVSVRAANEYREFAISVSPLREPRNSLVGRTIVFQDITVQRRRKQRLAILNRVLRHNLRNDLNVARGYVDLVAEQVDDDELASMLEGARDDIDGVISMGEKAWEFERAIDTIGDASTAFEPRAVFESIASDLVDERGGRIVVDIPESLEVDVNQQIFEQLFRNLLENGLEHSNAAEPRVIVSFEAGTDRTAAFSVTDDGPGIPEHELAVIERGKETSLEHGSGLGLWLMTWCVTSLGGEIAFDTADSGTTVTVTLPDALTTEERAENSSSVSTPPGGHSVDEQSIR